MRTLLLVFLVLSSPALADDGSRSLSACLPSVSGVRYDSKNCILDYQAPPPLKQDIKVTACAFLGGEKNAKTHSFSILECTVTNRSKEPIQAMKYGVRYFEEGNDEALLEDGFEQRFGFATGIIEGDLQPGETRILGFAGPRLPSIEGSARIVPTVEILGARTPKSFALR